MRNRALFLWLLAGVAGAVLLVWGYRRAFPFLPTPWSVSRDEAVAIALEHFRDLGDPVQDPYVVVHFNREENLERRLQLDSQRRGVEELRATGLSDQVLAWEVLVYPPGATREDWTYSAEVGLDGQLNALRLRLDPQAPGSPLAPEAAHARADAFLAQQGVDLAAYGEPELRTQQLVRRTDTVLRYASKKATLGAGTRFGYEVTFAGDRLTGYRPFVDDPQEKVLRRGLQGMQFINFFQVIALYLLLGCLGYPFLKRYHEGEIGVRRGSQLFLWVAGVGLLLVLMTARTTAQNLGMGFLTRQQISWMMVLFGTIFNLLPTAVAAFFAWSVGESVCRERWGQKLAAFDALFEGDWSNATVARSSLRGWAAGLAMAGGLVALVFLLRPLGVWPFVSFSLAGDAPWPGFSQAAGNLSFGLTVALVDILWLLPVAVRRLGNVAGVLVAAGIGAIAMALPLAVAPFAWAAVLAVLFAAVPLVLFLLYDLLTALLATLVAQTLIALYPLLTAQDSTLQLHAWLGVAMLAVPLVASLRYLGSGKEFVYNYDDVPPHVRRIADRERQRVELETARRIQSSILPDLPPRVAGIDVAHAYLPASEVGGDFYDVLALEDGRLAVAVGDVAGHGVSSGLVMSMAKSALAVQVTFDPEVAAVFRTLNRTIFQSARKRLLATLCYAVIDARRLEMLYASAGHLYPYRVSAGGRVEQLESTAYPLGVRGDLDVLPRTVRLAPGDTLFLLSDGLVEARSEGSEDLFGFERLEESLARHSNRTVEGMRDGVLADVARFTANAPREDDQTILVLRIP